jgi:ABC-2 type transport system ATP-binding protein
MALTAQHLIVIGKGRLIADTDMAEFIRTRSRSVARVRTTHPDALAARLSGPDVEISSDQDKTLIVSGLTTDQIGMTAGAAGITLLELTAQQASLEEAFIDLTRDAVEYRANTVGASS